MLVLARFMLVYSIHFIVLKLMSFFLIKVFNSDKSLALVMKFAEL